MKKDITKNIIIRNYINNFERILNKLNVDKTCFDKNIETLRIIKTENIYKGSYADYYFESNVIKVNNKIKDSIYHELLHMATTMYDKEEDVYYTGFSRFDVIDHQSYGEGINEGMTAIIDVAHFSKNKEDKELSTYKFTNLLTYLIDCNSLIKAYFERDLDKVEEVLTIFSDFECAKNLITSLDKIYYLELDPSVKDCDLNSYYKIYMENYLYMILCIIYKNYLAKEIEIDEFKSGIDKIENFALGVSSIKNDIIISQECFEDIKIKAKNKALTKLN